ncbi:MAG: tetratricopeptide repeat protein [Phormidesmis sp.]
MHLLQALGADNKRLQKNVPAAQTLCQWLGHLPLSIEVVAKLLARKPHWSVEKLLTKLKRKTQQHASMASIARLLHKKKRTTATQPDIRCALNAALALSWEQLNAAEQQLAVMLSLFALAPIPRELVQEVVGQCRVQTQPKSRWPHLLSPLEKTTSKQWCPLLHNQTLMLATQQLIKQGLLHRAGKNHYQLHRCIKAFLQTKGQTKKQAHQAAANGLAQATAAFQCSYSQTMTAIAKTIEPVMSVKAQARVKGAIPHMKTVAAQWKDTLPAKEKAECDRGLAQFYQTLNVAQEAERYFKSALETSKAALGAHHLDTAGSLHNLAELYQAQGRYNQAEPLYVQALAIHKSALGNKHAYIAANLHNLAELYQAQGRYQAAEPLFLQALGIWTATLGENNPLAASTLNNLAALYQAQKRYLQAEPLYKQALKISRTALGETHPHTATSLNNLALLYKVQKRYSETEPLYIQALEIRQTKLGKTHLDTASSLTNLAALYKAQKHYSKAEPLYVQSLNIRQAKLGDRHLSTAGNLFNLAEIYQNTQQYQKAFIAIQQALDIYIPVLSKNHPTTQTAMQWLELIEQTRKAAAL